MKYLHNMIVSRLFSKRVIVNLLVLFNKTLKDTFHLYDDNF